MKKPTFFPKPFITDYEFEDGETIETKVTRIVENKEPITDGAPIIYTKRDDGVIPAYNIRTDKWEIAQASMDAIHKNNFAKAKDFGVLKEKDKEEPNEALETDNNQSA